MIDKGALQQKADLDMEETILFESFINFKARRRRVGLEERFNPETLRSSVEGCKCHEVMPRTHMNLATFGAYSNRGRAMIGRTKAKKTLVVQRLASNQHKNNAPYTPIQ